jgi:hypothetical protein
MGLQEAIAELDVQAGEEPEVTVEEQVEELEEEAEKPAAAPAPEEPAAVLGPVEAVKPKLELPKPEVSESTAWYKAREAQRRAEDAEAKLAALTNPKPPAKEENYEGYIEHELGMTKQELADLKAWKQEQQQAQQQATIRNGAFRELSAYEAQVRAQAPDFDAAANHLKALLATSIKVQNPMIAPEDLAEQTLNLYAGRARDALLSGKHPGQALYEQAFELGYAPAEPEAPKPVAPALKMPSLAKLAENKKKSSGMANSGGNGAAFPTNDAVLSMTNAERLKLTESDWARLEQEGA